MLFNYTKLSLSLLLLLCQVPSNVLGSGAKAGPCKSGVYQMNKDRIISRTNYNGEFEKYDFTIDGDYEIKGDTLILKMSKAGSGATLQTTRGLTNGKVTALMKSSRTGGVVSSFITMSEDKDEIDFEWVGSQLKQVQTNFFAKGVIPENGKGNGGVHDTVDTFQDFHHYTINWNKDSIDWQVDNSTVRTYKNPGSNYPVSQSLISFGIWDGSSGAQGTREWAGGYVDFVNAQDIKTDGYFSVKIKSLEVQCYDEAVKANSTTSTKSVVHSSKLASIKKGIEKKIRQLTHYLRHY